MKKLILIIISTLSVSFSFGESALDKLLRFGEIVKPGFDLNTDVELRTRIEAILDIGLKAGIDEPTLEALVSTAVAISQTGKELDPFALKILTQMVESKNAELAALQEAFRDLTDIERRVNGTHVTLSETQDLAVRLEVPFADSRLFPDPAPENPPGTKVNRFMGSATITVEIFDLDLGQVVQTAFSTYINVWDPYILKDETVQQYLDRSLVRLSKRIDRTGRYQIRYRVNYPQSQSGEFKIKLALYHKENPEDGEFSPDRWNRISVRDIVGNEGKLIDEGVLATLSVRMPEK